ncbi:MAG TPA: hypothetical protein VNM24_04860 [Burkholderiales bacterium]|jgi:hypothetical protein|nr:hypothetical protein [Burkholderiales bacterium]
MIGFFAHFLFILAAWTLVIKYAFPVAYALAEGVAPTTYVYWDLWWVVHIWLGWSLLHWQRYTFAFAIVVSIAEIIIVATKFAIFFAAPEWSIWRTNWFVNKLFVLACFVLLLGYLLRNARALRLAAVRVPDSS